MKKIAILYSGSHFGGGVDTYYTHLFKYASKGEVELALFSLGEWPLTAKFEKEGYNLEMFSGTRFNPATIFKMSEVLKGGKYDLIVSQGTVANAYARAASLVSGVPSLVTIHSDHDLDYPSGFLRTVYRLVDLFSRWRTHKYIIVSEFLKQKAVRSGLKADRITVIYNGVEIPEKLPPKKANKRIMLGSIGRLHPVKNYTNLVEAMHQLSEDGCDLTIWGDGEERARLEKMIHQHELELSHNVFLPGHTHQKWEDLATVDIYVQPSLSEGFGLTVVEAQIAGLPVVVTPGGALPELINDGKTGIIAEGFAAKDIVKAVSRYLEDPKLQEACAKAGQKVATENYRIQDWANKTIECYKEAVK